MYIEMFSKWNCAKHQTGPLPQRSFGLRAMAEQYKRNKGSWEPDEWGFSTVWSFRGGGTGSSRLMERYSMQKALWPQRNFGASSQAPRNRLGMILESQGNQVLLLFNKVNTRRGKKVWLFAFDREQSASVRRSVRCRLTPFVSVPSDST